jgi:transcriptional regulator with XRE-family HTH domain
MSLRELSKYADISYTQISAIENGSGGNPSPITLRAISRGLAVDEFNDGKVDQIRADAFYRQLMDAAGYLGGLPIDAPAPETDDDDVVRYLAARVNDSDLAERLMRLVNRYPEMERDDQVVVRRLVESWVRDE